MSIQDIFYLLGSIFMTVGIIVLIFIGIVLLILANAIKSLQKLIEEKVSSLSRIIDNPSGVAAEIGTMVASTAVRKVKEMITGRSKSGK